MELITLRNLCELLKISRRSIQGYEKAGLLSPTTRNKYGYLLYDENAVKQAQRIQFYHQLGFRFGEIQEILNAPKDEVSSALKEKVKELELKKEQMSVLILRAKKQIEEINS